MSSAGTTMRLDRILMCSFVHILRLQHLKPETVGPFEQAAVLKFKLYTRFASGKSTQDVPKP